MAQKRNHILEKCLQIEGLFLEIMKYRKQAPKNPSLLLCAQPATLELIAILKQVTSFIKRSGDFELGTKLDDELSQQVAQHIILSTTERELPIEEKNKQFYFRFHEHFDKICEIEKKLSDWLMTQERIRDVGGSKIVDAELLEGLTKSRYICRVPETKLRKIFSSLVKQGYFGPKTTLSDWLYVCGLRKSLSNTIDWTKGQNELVYFIARMFADENENDVWSITSHLFTVKGQTQNPGTLRVANCRSNIKKEKKDKIDEILKII